MSKPTRITTCLFVLMFAMLTACSGSSKEPEVVEEVPKLEEVSFEASRVVINGAPDGYAGQNELEQAFDTNTFYYRNHVDDGSKYGCPILMRAEPDGSVKALCGLNGCRHDSPSCRAYDDSFGRYFTVGDRLYYLKTDNDVYSAGNPCLKIYRVTEDSREQIVDLNGSADFYESNENVITDGECLYIMVSHENEGRMLERVNLSDGCIEKIASFEELSGGSENSRVIMYPSEDGHEEEISGYYGPIELQAVSDDGGYILFVQKLLPIRSTHENLYVLRAFSIYDGSSTVIATSGRMANDSGSLSGRLYFYRGNIFRLNRKDAVFEKCSVGGSSWKLLWDLSNERDKFDTLKLKYFDGEKVIFKGQIEKPYITISTYVYDLGTDELSVNNLKTRSTILRNTRFPDIFAISPDYMIIDVTNYEDYTYDLAVIAKTDLYAENPRFRDMGHVSDFY